MRLQTTLLAAVGCLMLATSCKKPEETTQYATNKAGERLVEKIDFLDDNNIYHSCFLEYNSDGTLKAIKGYEGDYIFEKKGTTLFMHEVDGEEAESSFDLNENGWIVLDRGWSGNSNFRLTYDDNGYLHNIFRDEELLWTFEWEDGNIVNEEVTYIPTQSHPSNIDWCAFFQSWRHVETDDNTEYLVGAASICLFWGFSEGYLGNKCKGLPLTQNNGRTSYAYDFDEDGFVSTIYINGDPCYKVSYLKK